jgi:hypothetical protein
MPEEIIHHLPEQSEDPADWKQISNEAAQLPEGHTGLQALQEILSNPYVTEQSLGHIAVEKEIKAGARFLHQHVSVKTQEVDYVVGYLRQNGTTVAEKASDRMIAYLNFLAHPNIVDDGILTGNEDSGDYQIIAHVIQDKDVPESYFTLQQRVDREKGRGEIALTAKRRQKLIIAAQDDQYGSLEPWVEYLGGDEDGFPNWFKTYTWDSITKLGTYDKAAGKFRKRDAGTVATYPELDLEALAYVYDAVNTYYVQGENIQDTGLARLVKDGSFAGLYAHAVLAVTPDLAKREQDIAGSWTTFNQTDDERIAKRLSNSLRGYRTGWCTVGKSTAVDQLECGDFYVYYTRGKAGNDTIPRVAIRMEDGEVVEVRGVQAAMELEPIMAAVVAEKLTMLPGGEEYIRRAHDMKHMTAIDDLLNSNPEAELSTTDTIFLYELEQPIEGFGYTADPRIKKLQAKAANVQKLNVLEGLGAPTEIIQRMRSHLRVHTLVEQIQNRPDDFMSDADLRFIYGLDGPINTYDPEFTSELGLRVDSWRKGRDRDSLVRLVPEVLAEQMNASFEGYIEIAEQLGITLVNDNSVEQLFIQQSKTWQSDGLYEYIIEKLIKDETQFTLITTPNVVATYEQISGIVNEFGLGQPLNRNTLLKDQLYIQYTPEELSGDIVPNMPVRFSLIPNVIDNEIGEIVATQQYNKLLQQQQRSLRLNLHVPSVLDAVVFWHTLRAQGDTLSDNHAHVRTGIRHFNLPPKYVNGELSVPSSCVSGYGGPALGHSGVHDNQDALIAVG